MKRFNKRLCETARDKKAGLVALTLSGRFLDPPKDTIELEVCISEEMYERLWPVINDILSDHAKFKLAST